MAVIQTQAVLLEKGKPSIHQLSRAHGKSSAALTHSLLSSAQHALCSSHPGEMPDLPS